MHHNLATLPAGAELHGVTASPADAAGRWGLRVELDEATRTGEYGVHYVDQPTFVLLPDTLRDGTIEVDVLGRLRPDAPDYARAFIGVAYRVRVDPCTNQFAYESVYIRPLNGHPLQPPPPRDSRAVQYYAYPDWPFDRLRQEEPDGGWEAGADIAPGRWVHLRLDIVDHQVAVQIDHTAVLELHETKSTPAEGRVGLWADIGTEGFFANLRITPQ